MGDEIAFNFEEKMALAQAGDNISYELVLRKITPLIKNFIRKFDYKNLFDVDDLTQEVLLAIHKSSHTYDSLRPFKTWALAIANFKIKDALRSIYRQKKLSAVDFATVENSLFEEVDFLPEAEVDLESLLHVLKPSQQKIVRLLKIDGNSLEEVANKMGMSVAAVKISAHRAYAILTKKFGKK